MGCDRKTVWTGVVSSGRHGARILSHRYEIDQIVAALRSRPEYVFAKPHAWGYRGRSGRTLRVTRTFDRVKCGIVVFSEQDHESLLVELAVVPPRPGGGVPCAVSDATIIRYFRAMIADMPLTETQRAELLQNIRVREGKRTIPFPFPVHF